MDVGTWIMAGLLPALLALCGALSAFETAIFSLTFHDRMRLGKTSPRLARVVESLLARPRQTLITNLLINMLSSTLYMVVTTLVGGASDAVWIQVGLAVVNLLAMTLMAEVVSKMLAARFPTAVCRVLAPPMLAAVTLLAPLCVPLDRFVIEPLSRLLAPGREQAPLSPDELERLLELGARAGQIRSDEHALLRQVIAFGELRVRDIMTPRLKIAVLPETAAPDQVRDLVARSRLTRIPITRAAGASVGDARGLDAGVVGLLNTKRYLAARARALGEGPPVRLADFIEPPVYVPDSASLDRLLQNVRGSAVKIALCVDEHGVITGIISAQDVVGRLIAEMSDGAGGAGGAGAGDAGESDKDVRPEGPGRWSVPGRMGVREWSEMFGLEPDPRISTVAGLIMARLGRVPRIGDSISLGNLRASVQSLDGHLPRRVLVSLDERPHGRRGPGASDDGGRGGEAGASVSVNAGGPAPRHDGRGEGGTP